MPFYRSNTGTPHGCLAQNHISFYSVVSPRLINITWRTSFALPCPHVVVWLEDRLTLDLLPVPPSAGKALGKADSQFEPPLNLAALWVIGRQHTHVEQNPWEHELQSYSRLNNNLNCETTQLSRHSHTWLSGRKSNLCKTMAAFLFHGFPLHNDGTPHTGLRTVALFLITKFWKQCKYILTAGWSDREQYVHTTTED